MNGTFHYDFIEKQNICWTNTPYTPAALGQLPCIEMLGFQQEWSSAITSIDTWITRIKEGTEGNPYKDLYMGKPAEKGNYRLPFFSEYHHNTTQSWQENTGPLGETFKTITDYVETVGKAILPAAGIIFPKSYAGSVPASYSFTFNLINTYAGNNAGLEIQKNIYSNREFLENFIRNNLHDQNGALSVVPPLIYEIRIPGIRFAPAAIVSNLVINNKGMLNKLYGENYIYPDAWEVTVTITELINESRKIWNDAIQAKGAISTRVFSGDTPALIDLSNKAEIKAKQFMDNVVGASKTIKAGKDAVVKIFQE